jgi:hypothetical protein
MKRPSNPLLLQELSCAPRQTARLGLRDAASESFASLIFSQTICINHFDGASSFINNVNPEETIVT